MRISWLSIFALLLAACDAPTPATETPVASAEPALPPDVTAFRTRRDDCDHFRGEDPYDAERAAEIRAAAERSCNGTDAELTALRRRHAADEVVIAALADYEDGVEPLQ